MPMPLYIRDDDVDALAVEVQRLTRARNKTEAVRIALRHEIERVRKTQPMNQRLEKAKAIAGAMGPTDPDFDMKKFTDQMWGEK
jgi:antitoxin VapB